MRYRSSIALTALAASLAVSPAADAKTRHHHHHAVAATADKAPAEGLTASEQLALAQQQLSQMQAQLNALQAKIDGQASTQTASASQVAAATQLASAASAKADTALASVAAVKTAEAKTDKSVSAMAWAGNTSVNGRVFFNESNLHVQSNGVNSTVNGTGFNIKRMYLGVDHKFSDVYSATLLMDVSNVIGETANANFVTPAANIATGAISSQALVGKGLYIKNAFLQAKFSPALAIRAGAAPLPWIPYIEGIYGYRHIENTLVDRTNFGSTADWGVHVLGDLADGHISYQVSAIDGAGFRNVKVTKNIDFEGRVSAQYDGFFAAVGGYSGKRGNAVAGTFTPNTATRFNAALGFKNKQFTLGGEYFGAHNWNNVATVVQDSSIGYSVFGNYNLNPQWSVFGKYEWVKPNHLTNPADADHYFNVGVQWEPVKIVDLALVYKREATDNGSIATTNGTIGGGVNGTYDEVGIFGQIKF